LVVAGLWSTDLGAGLDDFTGTLGKTGFGWVLAGRANFFGAAAFGVALFAIALPGFLAAFIGFLEGI
jgi:hypothetical protein